MIEARRVESGTGSSFNPIGWQSRQVPPRKDRAGANSQFVFWLCQLSATPNITHVLATSSPPIPTSPNTGHALDTRRASPVRRSPRQSPGFQRPRGLSRSPKYSLSRSLKFHGFLPTPDGLRPRATDLYLYVRSPATGKTCIHVGSQSTRPPSTPPRSRVRRHSDPVSHQEPGWLVAVTRSTAFAK